MINAGIRVYGTHWCSDCKGAERYFREHDVAYEWIDIGHHPEGRQYVREVNQGQQIVPTRLDPFSPAQAVHRDLATEALQDQIGELNARLAAKERDTFAGLWLEYGSVSQELPCSGMRAPFIMAASSEQR